MGRPPKSPRDRDAVQQAILRAAKAHFERFGYRRAVMDEIARAAGIAKGSLYLHFPGKEALLSAVLAQLQQESAQRLFSAIGQAPTVTEKLRVMLREMFAVLAREPLLARLFAEDPEFQVVLQALGQEGVRSEVDQGLAFLRALLAEGVRSGELRPDLDLEVLPFVLGSLKFLHFYRGLLTDGRIESDRVIEGIVDLALRGLVAAPAPSRARRGHHE